MAKWLGQRERQGAVIGHFWLKIEFGELQLVVLTCEEDGQVALLKLCWRALGSKGAGGDGAVSCGVGSRGPRALFHLHRPFPSVKWVYAALQWSTRPSTAVFHMMQLRDIKWWQFSSALRAGRCRNCSDLQFGSWPVLHLPWGQISPNSDPLHLLEHFCTFIISLVGDQPFSLITGVPNDPSSASLTS